MVFEILYMVAVCGESGHVVAALHVFLHGVNFIRTEYRLLERLDIAGMELAFFTLTVPCQRLAWT